MTEDEMVGWHHRLDGHAFEQAPGVGGGQRGLARCSPWGSQRGGAHIHGMYWASQVVLTQTRLSTHTAASVQSSRSVMSDSL